MPALTVPFQTYSELLSFLEGLGMSVMKLGTERMVSVMQAMGNPQDKTPSIHVVGTNGKGSTCAFLESIYRAVGYRTGLFISPHLVDIRERIQLQGKPVLEGDFLEAATAIYQGMVATFPQKEDWLTYFEFINAMAFWLFAQRQVDIAIIEAGLGGRLDSTNVIHKPKAIVMTSVSYDHTDRLGVTLEAIAAEKAAVFRAEVPVITLPQDVGVMQVIESQAKPLKAPLVVSSVSGWQAGQIEQTADTVYRVYTTPKSDKTYKSGVLGPFMAQNLAMALDVVQCLAMDFPVLPEAITLGVAQTVWPARYQYFPQHRLLLDGSHNAQGITALVDAIQLDFSDKPILLGISLLQTKALDALLPLFKIPNLKALYCFPGDSLERFYPPETLSNLACSAGVPERLIKTELSPLDFCRLELGADSLKVLTGSLYTAGHVLADLTLI